MEANRRAPLIKLKHLREGFVFYYIRGTNVCCMKEDALLNDFYIFYRLEGSTNGIKTLMFRSREIVNLNVLQLFILNDL